MKYATRSYRFKNIAITAILITLDWLNPVTAEAQVAAPAMATHLTQSPNTTTIQFMQNNYEAQMESDPLPLIQDSLPASDSPFDWEQLACIPDRIGYAGSFIGVAGGALLFAGGANFPDGGAPWNGDPKVWYDTIYALDALGGSWKVVGHLPRPLGYGVSLTWMDHLIMAGGSNAAGGYRDVFVLSYQGGEVKLDTLPDLPEAVTNACGALVGDKLYIAGGQQGPEAMSATHNFWMLDLKMASDQRAWKVLPSWPGKPRMLSVAGVVGDNFILCSGTALEDGKRDYLKDAYAYDPGSGWRRLQDLPWPVVAAPSPAYQKDSALYLFGGDDGRLATGPVNLKAHHPGFSSAILKYDIQKDSWTKVGAVLTQKKKDAVENPNGSIWAPVSTTLAVWQGRVILAGGEVRPSTRTPRVLMAIPLASAIPQKK